MTEEVPEPVSEEPIGDEDLQTLSGTKRSISEVRGRGRGRGRTRGRGRGSSKGRSRGRGRAKRARGRGRNRRMTVADCSSGDEDEEEVEEEVEERYREEEEEVAEEDDLVEDNGLENPLRMFDLEAVREYIICSLCGNFLQDTHSISECLHSFCRKCLVGYFGYIQAEAIETSMAKEESSSDVVSPVKTDFEDDISHGRFKGAPSCCPVCQIDLGADPMKACVKSDPIMQNITDKLIHFLNASEKKQEDNVKDGERTKSEEQTQTVVLQDSKRKKTVFQLLPCEISLNESKDWESLPLLNKAYIETWNRVTIRQLKKYLSEKLSIDNGLQVLDILCCGESLGAEYNLEFIRRTRWHDPSKSLQLHYRKKIEK